MAPSRVAEAKVRLSVRIWVGAGVRCVFRESPSRYSTHAARSCTTIEDLPGQTQYMMSRPITGKTPRRPITKKHIEVFDLLFQQTLAPGLIMVSFEAQ